MTRADSAACGSEWTPINLDDRDRMLTERCRVSADKPAAALGRGPRANRSQRLGHNRERQIRKQLEQEGWYVIRAAGSLGASDLVALKAGETARLIEVKTSVRVPWRAAWSRAERQRIIEAARQAGADAWLAWWPSGGQLAWMHESEWPSL